MSSSVFGSFSRQEAINHCLEQGKECEFITGGSFTYNNQPVFLYRLKNVHEGSHQILEETNRLKEECRKLSLSLGLEDDLGREERRHKEIINKLHDYNECKDLGQALMGILAMQKGCTTRDLYGQFDINLED